MTLVPTSQIVAAAARAGRAVVALNVITLEHAEAIASAAEAVGLPVVLQISENAVRFHGGDVVPVAAATAAVARSTDVSMSLHLDHVTDETLAEAAASAGFSSLMFDAGALPYADNVARTAQVAARAQATGLWVEAELGYVGGKPDAPRSAHAVGVRTDPGEAVEYVAATGVDALAVAVGSSHAMTTQSAGLDLDLVARLHERVPVPLVLHGSSGVPDDQLRAAVRAGIAKVNIGTALNVAMTGAVRAVLQGDERLVDPRTYLAAGREAMSAAAARLLELLR